MMTKYLDKFGWSGATAFLLTHLLTAAILLTQNQGRIVGDAIFQIGLAGFIPAALGCVLVSKSPRVGASLQILVGAAAMLFSFYAQIFFMTSDSNRADFVAELVYTAGLRISSVLLLVAGVQAWYHWKQARSAAKIMVKS